MGGVLTQTVGRNPVVTGPTASPHRYWRIWIGTNSDNAGGLVTGASEIELRESVGGADATGSGTASSDSDFAGFSAAGAFANDTETTGWASASSAYPHWIAYDFGSGVTKAIVEVGIYARTAVGGIQGPGAFKIQSSDDGTTWADEWWVAYPGGSNGHSYGASFKSFTKPTVDQSPSASRHRYWRLSITGSNGGSYVGANDISMRTVSGSVDETEGGTATSRSNFSGLTPSQAFETTTGSITATALDWASNNVGFPEWIQYDFGSGGDKLITEMTYRARVGLESSQAPTGIDFQYSDDGSSFTTIKSVSSLTWSAGVPQTWTLP